MIRIIINIKKIDICNINKNKRLKVFRRTNNLLCFRYYTRFDVLLNHTKNYLIFILYKLFITYDISTSLI